MAGDRPYTCQRALRELQLAFAADSDHARDLHLWMFDLHLDRCRAEGAVTPECAICGLTNVCEHLGRMERRVARLSDAELLHLSRTLSVEAAEEDPGSWIRIVLEERGLVEPIGSYNSLK